MDFDDLQALVWVHQHGSLQSASRATGVSRTTLRRRLEHLKALAGHTLYRSTHDGIQLTPTGRALVEEGVLLLAARARLVERVQRLEPKDHLRVLVQVGMPPVAIAAGAALFSKILPDVHVSLDVAIDPGARLAESFDAILHWGESPVLAAGYTRTLMRVAFGVMGAPEYLAEHGTPETPADLANHRLLHQHGTSPQWPLVSGETIDITPAHTCADLYLLGLLAGQGLGLALMPIQGPAIDGPMGPASPVGGPMVHPSIDALTPVLADHIAFERSFRIDMPQPSQDDSAAAMVIRIAETFGQAFAEIAQYD